MAIKSKNIAKIFLEGGQMTKIKTKLYIFIFYFFFTYNFFFPYFGGIMAHPLPPSLSMTHEGMDFLTALTQKGMIGNKNHT